MKAETNFPEEEIKGAKEHKAKDENKKEKEESEAGSPAPDSNPFSIGALMVKMMIEAYERRN